MTPSPCHPCDALLVSRCVARDEPAWRELRALHEGPLERWIRRAFHAYSRHGISCDDLAENVWEALCDKDFRRLRAFDPRRASFQFFLQLQARHELDLVYRRPSFRCPPAELGASSVDVEDRRAPGPSLELLLDDFGSVLTQRELSVLDALRSGDADGLLGTLSGANLHKVMQRIARKGRLFVKDE